MHRTVLHIKLQLYYITLHYKTFPFLSPTVPVCTYTSTYMYTAYKHTYIRTYVTRYIIYYVCIYMVIVIHVQNNNILLR